ncbi:LysR family transcriptional regulator [Achromobacter aegrifaciens]|uniref:LysR family transcriptional regulator n=1 Tax=Achromobacter aegrifaciens TaxID=1287736 RepID=UPI000750C67D|nr:LysR family transcriptional regulator [Achromobacter aegrifaciens]WLW59671.1 LysR family transcriptional regulator [Achromobacter aegrifaciens]
MTGAIEPDHLVSKLRFRHLRMLQVVQGTGSLRAASQALNLTQPALSKALTEVESAFGFALFLRTARGLKPTAQGEVVLRGAALLLEELGHLRTDAQTADRYAAKIRIGAPPFLAQTYLRGVVEKLVNHARPMRVQLLEERVPALLHALELGEIDALISTFPLQMLESGAAAFQYVKLFEVQFAVIAAASHPLVRARRVDWTRLARERWIMPAEGSMGRKLIEDCFIHAGLPAPLPVVESTSPTTGVQFVASGLGIGIVPDMALIRHDVALAGAVRQIRVLPEPPSSVVALITRKGPANPRIALLREALGEALGAQSAQQQ